MKKLRYLLLLMLGLNPIFLYSQFKVQTNGNVSVGTTSDYGASLNVRNYNKRGISINSDWSVSYGQAIRTVHHRQDGVSYVVNYQYYSTNKDLFFIMSYDGSCYTWGDYYTLSDSTIKNDIREIESPLQKIKSLDGITYLYKEEILNKKYTDGTLKRRYGFLAQDVERILPEVVEETKDGQLAISYASMVPLLVEAIKEQQMEIDALKEELNTTKKTLTNLSSNMILRDINSIYPNPADQSSVAEIFITGDVNTAKLLFYDLNGKLIKSIEISDRGEIIIPIQAEVLTKGTYFCSLSVDGQILDTQKFVVGN